MKPLRLGTRKYQLDARCCLSIQRDRDLMLRLGWTEKLGTEVDDAFEVLDSTIKFGTLNRAFFPLREHYRDLLIVGIL